MMEYNVYRQKEQIVRELPAISLQVFMTCRSLSSWIIPLCLPLSLQNSHTRKKFNDVILKSGKSMIRIRALFKEESSNSDYRLEYLTSRLSLVNGSELCFTTSDSTYHYLNRLQNGKCLKQKITENLINAIPLGNQWLVTAGKQGSMNPDTFVTYLLDDQGLRYDLPSPVHLKATAY